MRGLCTRPYHAHPRGCPNYGRRDTCPPAAPFFFDTFDAKRDIWALWTEFDIGRHREKQRRRHATWSERALVNPRHWQGTVRAFLRRAADEWLTQHACHHPRTRDIKGFEYTTCPEAMGVNLTATMRNVGVHLEWPPRNTTRLIYLAGVRK